MRQFDSALVTANVDLRLPSHVGVEQTLLDENNGLDDDANDANDDDDDEERDLRTNPTDIEHMIERTVARTISRAYDEMLARISPPGTPPPPPPALMLPGPPEPIPLRPPRVALPVTPPPRRTPNAPPSRPRRARLSPQSNGRGIPLDTVLLRVRGRRESQLVVRLPGGGFSYAPNPLYAESPVSTTTQNARRSRRTRRPYGAVRAADIPIVRQAQGGGVFFQDRVHEMLRARQNERIRRIRRQLRLDQDERPRMGVLPSRPQQSPVLAWSDERPRMGVLPSRLPQSPVLAWSALASTLTNSTAQGAEPGASGQETPRLLIPSFVATEEMGVPEGKCGICLENFKVGTRVSIIPCQPDNMAKDHVFCHECIERWVVACRGQRTCPLCRGRW